MVQALPAYGPHPAFGERVRAGCLHRRAHHFDAADAMTASKLAVNLELAVDCWCADTRARRALVADGAGYPAIRSNR
jgi:hypothetical protein